MKKLLIVCVLLMMFVVGCTMLRQTAVDVSNEEVKNAETAREVAEKYLAIWPIQSGFIQGALGPRMDEIPTQVVDAIDELDRLAAQCADPNDCTDYDLGMSLGLRVRMLSSVIAEGLKFYVPEAIEFAPFLF